TQVTFVSAPKDRFLALSYGLSLWVDLQCYLLARTVSFVRVVTTVLEAIAPLTHLHTLPISTIELAQATDPCKSVTINSMKWHHTRIYSIPTRPLCQDSQTRHCRAEFGPRRD